MAITAQFDADFSQFNTEVGKAEQQLNLFEMSAEKTQTAINGMGTTTTSTAPKFTAMTQGMRQFDGVLSAAGIHIGPAIKAIEEIGGAAGKSALALGFFGTAGLVLATALAAWTVGRGAVSFLKWFGVDVDAAVAKAATSLGWFKDVVKETSAALEDEKALASKRAEREITDINEARKVNQQWVDDKKKNGKEAIKADEEQLKAMEAVRIAGQDWAAVLKTMTPATIAQAKAALDHGVAQDTVAKAYGLTAPQIAAVTSALKADEEAAKKADEAHAKLTAELKTHWDAVLAIRDEALGKDAVEKATQWTEAIFLLGNSVDKLSHEQLVDLQKVMDEAMTAMARNGNLTAEQALQFNDFSAAAMAAAAALKPVVDVTNELAAAQTEQAAASGAALGALQQVADASNTWGLHPGGQAPRSSGVIKQASDNLGNMFLVNTQTGEIVEALERKFGDGFLGWGPKGPPPTINIMGHVLGTENELGRIISDALANNYRAGGNRMPA